MTHQIEEWQRIITLSNQVKNELNKPCAGVSCHSQVLALASELERLAQTAAMQQMASLQQIQKFNVEQPCFEDDEEERTPKPCDVELSEDLIRKAMNRPRRNRKIGMFKAKQSTRICSWCNSRETIQWRSGPNSQILCNKCGLQYRKFSKLQEEESSKQKLAIRSLLN